MRVWLDWDSGPYETASATPLSNDIVVEISDEDWRDLQEVLRRYDAWQKRLRTLRKGSGDA